MLIPIGRKNDHLVNAVSKKSVKRFIETGLKVLMAKPALYYHQTLTFPKPTYDTKGAKFIFNRFMKGVMKFYNECGLAALHVQERRKDGTLHFHVCFLIFAPDRFPFAPSRRYRDFRTDLYKRWSKLNSKESVHDANKLIQHDFNFDTIYYFCQALEVFEEPPKRAETNWWGFWNRQMVNNPLYKPPKNEVNSWFNEMFIKSKRNRNASTDLSDVSFQSSQLIKQFLSI